MIASRQYKVVKYKDFHVYLHSCYHNYSLTSFTVEVTVLGFIYNLSDFARFVSVLKLSQVDKALITHKALSSSLDIYYSRNKID